MFSVVPSVRPSVTIYPTHFVNTTSTLLGFRIETRLDSPVPFWLIRLKLDAVQLLQIKPVYYRQKFTTFPSINRYYSAGDSRTLRASSYNAGLNPAFKNHGSYLSHYSVGVC